MHENKWIAGYSTHYWWLAETVIHKERHKCYLFGEVKLPIDDITNKDLRVLTQIDFKEDLMMCPLISEREMAKNIVGTIES